jgi:hypothetical protein
MTERRSGSRITHLTTAARQRVSSETSNDCDKILKSDDFLSYAQSMIQVDSPNPESAADPEPAQVQVSSLASMGRRRSGLKLIRQEDDTTTEPSEPPRVTPFKRSDSQ